MTLTEEVNIHNQVNAIPQHHLFVSVLLLTVINIQSIAKVSLS